MENIKMNDCKVNHIERTIVCGKTFMEKASRYGTDEYSAFVGATRDFPDYKVIVVKPKKAEAKMSMKGLTCEFMEHHIVTLSGKDSDEHQVFLNQMKASEAYRNSYMYMRKWFVKKYPDWDGKEEQRKKIRAKKAAAKTERAQEISASKDDSVNEDNSAM